MLVRFFRAAPPIDRLELPRNETMHSSGVDEQCVYGFGNCVYLEDDKVTSIQQSRAPESE